MNHILIVEDDTTLREGLAAALRNAAATTCTAADLAGARRILRERTFDLLLLDCNRKETASWRRWDTKGQI